MYPYYTEQFSHEEQQLLSRYFTNTDKPVFALVNLPEVVKGALFARYSRSPKSLRRLFLDEFAGDLSEEGSTSQLSEGSSRRAKQLYDRVFVEYGDDSIAQLGGVHLACEQASNLLTKVLERGRLMSYLEQSTRYISYDTRLENGLYRYWRDPLILESPLGARYVGELDRMFDTYAELLPKMRRYLTEHYPPSGNISVLAHRRAVNAKALDLLRGILPAAALSNVGIYGDGQSFEMLLMRMRSHPLPEARAYADMILTELRKVIPAFLSRVDQPNRGGAWTKYLFDKHLAMKELTEELLAEEENELVGEPYVRLLSFDPHGEEKILAAMLFPYANCSELELSKIVSSMSYEQKRRIFKEYVGNRQNRRHRPGRAFEASSYRFEVVSDYGSFRDLQRHRIMTIEWQPLTTNLGYEIPRGVIEAGLAVQYEESLERSKKLYTALLDDFPVQAAYVVALAYNIRYVLEMNAREAMHVIELRSSAQGHPAYRRIAQKMHHLIGEEAGHRLVAEAMSFVDYADYDLERLDAEVRHER